jgi:spermidine/putrescine transport system ATP-binding protein
MPDFGIVLEGVTKRFGETVAVNDVSLSVRHGEFMSIIGPSGCGKTTTLRLIAGLEQPDSGAITIGGRRMEAVPPYERNVGLVFQNFALFPHLNVVQNVEFGLRMRGVEGKTRRERALRALKTVGLQGFAGRNVGQLSGGQMQRVGLARALAIEPALILLDEPLGSLDAKLRIEMQSELKALQRQMGITFIHVSHNQSEALAMADHIAVMSFGEIQQIGTPQEIYAEPNNRFVAGFVGTNNIFEGEVQAVVDGRAEARTRDGSFLIPTEGRTVEEGKPVTFLVRADRLKTLDKGEEDIPNRVSGTVKALEYTGSIVTTTIELAAGREIKIEQHESLTRQANAPRHGDEIVVGWRLEETYVLPS